MRRIRTLNPKRGMPKGISQQDFLALLTTTKVGSVTDLRDRAIMFFLTDTGCRVLGLCGLCVQDVDFNTKLATVTEKYRKTRFVPFNLPTEQAL